MTDNYPSIEAVSTVQRKITKPTTEILPLSPVAFEYLTKKRGLLPSTIKAYRLACDKFGNIVIPFFDENNELALVKFRHPKGELLQCKRKLDDGSFEEYQAKTRIEKGGKGILFGSHLCDSSEGPLVICFGDYDAMSVSQDGVPNCVALPFGDGGFDFIKLQWSFLAGFEEIILYPDQDKYPNSDAEIRAKKKLDDLASRLGKHRVKIVRTKDRFGTKDANELLLLKGKDANRTAITNAEYFPAPIVAVADYEEVKPQPGTPIGLPEIDRIINGFAPGNLILISGDNEAGKTSNVLNFLASFVEERVPAFIWSGEQTVRDVRYWFERIVAGPGYLKREVEEKTGFEYFFPLDEVKESIRNWYREYLFQYTEVGIDAQRFFEAAELGVRRYGCGVIVADNLMAFTGGEGEGYYQAQGDFAQMMKAFAVKWNIPAVLICHNKKEKDWEAGKPKLPNKDSVEGSKKITSWADVLLQIYRVPNNPQYREALENADSIISICKSRGKSKHVNVKLTYDDESNRLFQMSEDWKRTRKFSWKSPYENQLNSEHEKGV